MQSAHVLIHSNETSIKNAMLPRLSAKTSRLLQLTLPRYKLCL